MGSPPVILIDTHIWVWWANGSSELDEKYRHTITGSRNEGIGVSAISCWEVGKLVEKRRIILSIPVIDWMDRALRLPGVEPLPLTPEIALASTLLPGEFHGDPADRFIVATSRALDLPLLTQDGKILAYTHVTKVNTN